MEGGEKITDPGRVVRGDVYLCARQLAELSRTFSHFLLGSRKLKVGQLLARLPPFDYGGVSRRGEAV